MTPLPILLILTNYLSSYNGVGATGLTCEVSDKKPASNNPIATINNWGPEYRVMVDLIVHSNHENTWSNILRFTASDEDCCNIGDRIPAIFYNSKGGYLLIDSAVGDKGNRGLQYNIDLEQWYHIVIEQIENNGEFYYVVNINGTEKFNLLNTNPQSFPEVTVFAGGRFNAPTDATYRLQFSSAQ